MDLANQINTLGVENGDGEIGGLTSRTQREAIVADDYHNAWVSGAAHALGRVNAFAASKVALAGPYDDTRALRDLQTWVADMIREVHDTKATDGRTL